jgi:dsRNA-specific ribonuclease
MKKIVNPNARFIPRLINQTQEPTEYTSEHILKYVLNEKNKLITVEVLENIFKKYNIKHKVKNLKNFQEALTHSSYVERDLLQDRLVKIIKEKNIEKIPDEYLLSNKLVPLQKVSYERLEFLGDSLIHLATGKYLFNRYSDQQEGFLTRLRTKIESGNTLSQFAIILGLHEYVLIGRNLEQMTTRDGHIHILEDSFEAFIGALYSDTNSYEVCDNLFVKLIEDNIDIPGLISTESNHKDTLLQYYHQKKYPDPEYGTKSIIEADKTNIASKKIFNMYVKGFIKNNNDIGEEWGIVGYGSATSKKAGEQEAAKQALIYYGVLNENESNDDEVIIIKDSDFNYS